MATNFPDSLDDVDSLLEAQDLASSTLSTAITAAATSLTVASGASFPATTGILRCEDELIKYVSRSSNTFSTLTRGYSSSTAASHPAGATIALVVAEDYHNNLKDAVIEIEKQLGVYSRFVNVESKGAKGDGSTDDTTAFQDAFNALPADGGMILVPSGIYVLSDLITYTNKPICIQGMGRGNTILKCTSVNGGIQLTIANAGIPVTVRGLTFAAGAAAAGNGLKVNYQNTATNYPVGFLTIDDVDFAPWTDATHYWTKAIEITNGQGGKLSKIYLRGRTGGTLVGTGIDILGASTDIQLSMIQGFSMATGINIGGTTEGPRIHYVNLVTVTDGIVASTAADASLLEVIGGHINAARYCLQLSKRSRPKIIGMLLYKPATSTSNWVGIYLQSTSSLGIIAGNTFEDLGGSGTVDCISLEGSSTLDIFGNRADSAVTNLIKLDATSLSNFVHGNRRMSTGTTIGGTIDTTNQFKDNYVFDSEVENLVAGDTTPSVGGTRTQYKQTANTGATSITTFDDGYLGQVFDLLMGDANTTLVHGATLLLQGGVNYSPGAGAVSRFRKETAGWRETSRRTA